MADLNEIIETIPERTMGASDTMVMEATAGQRVKIEASPGGTEIDLGVVPPGQKWLLKFVVAVEQVDA